MQTQWRQAKWRQVQFFVASRLVSGYNGAMLNPFIQIAIIALASFCAQWIAWKLRIPAIVFLLALGFFVGPITHMVDPNALFGDLLQPFVGLAVAIILFEGSMQLRLREIREVRRTVTHVVIAGATIGWGLMALAAHYIGGLSWPVACTFAGLLVVTGPTVILPLLRHSKIAPRTASVLKWEGIINDPIGVIIAVLCYEFFARRGYAVGDITDIGFFLEFGALVLGISLVSYAVGWLTAEALERGFVPEYLKAPFSISMVVILFVACNELLHESGLIAVTVMGMTLTNKHVASIEEIRKFKESISVLLISGVFILLTASLEPRVLLEIDWRGALFVLAVVITARPLTIWLASFGTKMQRNEVLLIGWLAPRGIVCAAVAGVMGPLLVEAGYPDGEKLLPLAFSIVLITVLLHGLTARKVARKLGLADESKEGLLIVGATAWSVQLAEALKSKDVPVLIADKNWYSLRAPRLMDIPVYYGEILSEESEYQIELHRFSNLLATTDDHVYNSLVCHEFAADYSRENVFQLPEVHEETQEHRKIPATLRGRFFLSQQYDPYTMARRYSEGWRFRITRKGPADVESEKSATDNGNSVFAGIISKSGKLSLAGDSNHNSALKAEEGDFILTFAMRAPKEEQAA
jgi:NhaP-type Na+/H+ or K+/H+ antiporter